MTKKQKKKRRSDEQKRQKCCDRGSHEVNMMMLSNRRELKSMKMMLFCFTGEMTFTLLRYTEPAGQFCFSMNSN